MGTVQGVQGSERDFIIISFVRSTSDDVQDIVQAEEARLLSGMQYIVYNSAIVHST